MYEQPHDQDSTHPKSAKGNGEHTLLARGLLDLFGITVPDKAVVGLKLLEGVVGVVDQSKTSGLSATELGAETEDGDLVFVGLVQLSKLAAELILGNVGSIRVEDITIQSQGCSLVYRIHDTSNPPVFRFPAQSSPIQTIQRNCQPSFTGNSPFRT